MLEDWPPERRRPRISCAWASRTAPGRTCCSGDELQCPAHGSLLLSRDTRRLRIHASSHSVAGRPHDFACSRHLNDADVLHVNRQSFADQMLERVSRHRLGMFVDSVPLVHVWGSQRGRRSPWKAVGAARGVRQLPLESPADRLPAVGVHELSGMGRQHQGVGRPNHIAARASPVSVLRTFVRLAARRALPPDQRSDQPGAEQQYGCRFRHR